MHSDYAQSLYLSYRYGAATSLLANDTTTPIKNWAAIGYYRYVYSALRKKKHSA